MPGLRPVPGCARARRRRHGPLPALRRRAPPDAHRSARTVAGPAPRRPRLSRHRVPDVTDDRQHRRHEPQRGPVLRASRAGAARALATRRGGAVHHRRWAVPPPGRHGLRAPGSQAAAPAAAPAAGVRLARAPAPVVDGRGLPAGRLRRLREARGYGPHRDRPSALCARRADADQRRGRSRPRPPGGVGGDGGAGPALHRRGPCRYRRRPARGRGHRMRDLRPGLPARRGRRAALPALRQPPPPAQAGQHRRAPGRW